MDPGHPTRPRRATANYSADYFPSFHEDEQELVQLPVPRQRSLRQRKSARVVSDDNDDGDDSDDEPLLPQRPPHKRARVTKRQSVPDLSDEIPSHEDFPDDAQDEFAREWNRFLAPELCESEVDDGSDAEWEDASGEIADLEDEEELALSDDGDFAAALASAASSDSFLPKFLDRTARLDKDYPDVESFLQDNKSAIRDFETIVTSACRFVHNFVQTLDIGKYRTLPRDQQPMSVSWVGFMLRADPDAVARKCLQAVPVQAAATLGREDFTIQDLDRLPHFPKTPKLFGGYFDHIEKTLADDSFLDEFAYAGFSAPEKSGAWTGRIARHLTHLGKNYQDLDPLEKTYHYEKGCADPQPRTWDEDKDGPWEPRWECTWDFRAFSLSYPDASIASVHQANEGIIHSCFNMIAFDCPTRPRTKSNSVAVEKFVSDLRRYVEKDLGRPLPDLQSNSLNRSLSFFEPMTHCQRRSSDHCHVKGCKSSASTKHLFLSIMGDPYSARVCVTHFGETDSFLSRSPCVDCGLERKDHPQARYWSVSRCYSCQRKHRLADPAWLARPPCENCGVTRDKDNSTSGWDKICEACSRYFRKNGTARPKEMEARRQAWRDVQDTAAENIVNCHNCGLVVANKTGSSKGDASSRMMSRVDNLVRCRYCHVWKNDKNEERPWTKWDGIEALGAYYSAMFMQWRSAQPLGEHECVCGRTRQKRRGTGTYYRPKCQSCYKYPGAVHLWPAFHVWIDNTLVVQTGQSIKELFMAVREDPIYASTTKTRTAAEKKRLAEVAEPKNRSEEDEDEDEPVVLQPMAQPPASGKARGRSARPKKTS